MHVPNEMLLREFLRLSGGFEATGFVFRNPSELEMEEVL